MLTVGTDTYISQADAITYLQLYVDETAEITEFDLRRAAITLDRMFQHSFDGVKTDADQPLEFPRTVDSLDIGVPLKVGQAQAELALYLNANPTFSPFAQNGQKVIQETVTVGPITETTHYATHTAGAPSTMTVTPEITRRIRTILSAHLAPTTGITWLPVRTYF